LRQRRRMAEDDGESVAAIRLIGPVSTERFSLVVK
jgi:hypothetical protein